MTYWSDTSDELDLLPLAMPRRSRKMLAKSMPVAIAFSFSALVGAKVLSIGFETPVAPLADKPTSAPFAPLPQAQIEQQAQSAPQPETVAEFAASVTAQQADPDKAALLDPNFSLGVTPAPLAESAPLGTNFALLRPSLPEAAAQPQIAEAAQGDEAASQGAAPMPVPRPAEAAPAREVADLAPAPLLEDKPLVSEKPLPPQRPAELTPPEREAPAHAAAPARRAVRTARVQPNPAGEEDHRSFFEKMFGAQKPSGSALAYASPEDGAANVTRLSRTSPSPFASRGGTAVYDISAHTVYLPSGATLEAHSGLGPYQDDPGHVHLRMRGATPPSVYDLTLRESLFHGVQALRLNPVSGNVYGRSGLLAHTYMLGQGGASNGCVSFKNYRAFLQAYMSGEVKKLVVVAHR